MGPNLLSYWNDVLSLSTCE